MTAFQPGILAPVPTFSRYLELRALPDEDAAGALRALAARPVDDLVVVGIGPAVVQGLGRAVPGLTAFPAYTGPGCDVPSTQADLWIWTRGTDRGHILHRAREEAKAVAGAFAVTRKVDGFGYDIGRDLSGFEDGTENPKGDAATAAAFASGLGAGLDGSSFVAVQQWIHDLDRLDPIPTAEREDIVGRRLDTNEEMEDAPASSHVKRTAQESFDPEAFVLRRSMPWADGTGEGLMFVAFGKSFYAYDAQMRRMAGLDDGIIDGLFRFTRPVSGSYFWCPPVAGGRLDLSATGL